MAKMSVTAPCKIDRIDELTYKARGIVQMIRGAADSELPDDAIPGACWAVESLLDEIKAVARQ